MPENQIIATPNVPTSLPEFRGGVYSEDAPAPKQEEEEKKTTRKPRRKKTEEPVPEPEPVAEVADE